MPRSRVRLTSCGPILLALTVLAGACSNDPTDSDRPDPAEIRLLSPATQSGTPGWPLADSVVVEVLDANGNPISGVSVEWNSTNSGAGQVGFLSDTTDAAGRAAAEWTLGIPEGQQTLSASVGSLDPVTVTATATIFHAAAVTVGSSGFACALTEAGQAWCWGANTSGELGQGTVASPVLGSEVLVPAPVAGDLVFTALTAAGHACGLTGDGTAYCWGPNLDGETGTGTFTENVTTPTAVATDLRFTTISADGIGVNGNSTCGLTASGQAWCWGDNRYGKLGNGTTESSAVPVQVESDVAFNAIWTGYWHVCARATTGELWCWGEQEGDPGAFGAGPAELHTTPVTVHPEFRFEQLSMGENFTCGVTAEHSTVCWGNNLSSGALGNGSDFENSAVPVTVLGGHDFRSLSSPSHKETYGLTAGGAVYRWGSPGNDIPQATPVLVSAVTFSSMDAGSAPFSFFHGACGIGAGNAVYCISSPGDFRGVPAP